MTDPKLVVPISKEEFIAPAKSEGADILYVDFRRFIKNNRFSKPELARFIKVSHKLEIPIYLYFGDIIYEDDLNLIKNIIDELSGINIDGIMVNDFSVMEIIKTKKYKELKFNIHLDSGLNIHNIASYELLKKWKAKTVNITEEIYLKNVTRIKKYTGKNICISINEVMWLLHYAVNWGIDLFKIDGTYEDLNAICLLISLLKDLISDVKQNKTFDNIKIEQVLTLMDHTQPQKHYRTDHFTKKFKDFSGNDFEFTGNIKIFNWNDEDVRPPNRNINFPGVINQNTKLRLRLTRLSQVEAVKNYIINAGINFIDIIEYGDIINPADLAIFNYTNIIKKVKTYCKDLGIKLYLTTPNILIERDFERVVDTMKYLCYKEPQPEGLVVNNLGIWRTISNSRKLKDFNIELGYGLNIINSKAVTIFNDICPVHGISIPNHLSLNHIKSLIKNITIPNRSYVILGPAKLGSSGLCPLNSDLAIVSRLQCKAPCQNAHYAVVDPFTTEMMPMILDGFCRFHLVNSYIDDQLKQISKFVEAGITDFILDFSALPAEMIPPLLDRYCLSVLNPLDYTPIEKEVIKYQPKRLIMSNQENNL